MTISDIAKMAGVSSAAVSRYLNGGPLSEQKREAIREVEVDVLLGEVDALALQGLDDEVVYWPEGILREGVCLLAFLK